MRTLTALLAFAASASAACGPPSVRPTNYADPEIACPGGRTAWVLEIQDQRAEPEGTEKMVDAIRNGIQKSFPGCRWTPGPAKDADVITIEVHRFASVLHEDAWDAAADWTVRAQNAGGRTLTEFEANMEVARPNYRGSNNEKESLTEVYRKALERTVKGLRAVPAMSGLRVPAPAPLEPNRESR